MLQRTVPRYTSYPTAPNFTGAIGASRYRSWLEALPEGATLSLYLHVPFCAQLCLYCGCHTKVTLRRAPVEAYARRLMEEVDQIGRHAGGRKVVHLHWGGGTPSMLGSGSLAEIHAMLRERFDLTALREHAIELDPRRLTQPLAQTLAEIGVNRASLGVQDLNPLVQQAAGRIQPMQTVRSAVAMLRDAGIDNINFDLMYGLPKQTVSDVRHTIDRVHTLQPRRLAIFGYAHVPWFKVHQRLIEDADLPDARERLKQVEAAHTRLLKLGYQPLGLDHYACIDDDLAIAARAGRLHRNFQGYTVDEADALIGLGASAIGRLPQGFVQNATDLGGYSHAIAAGELATVRGIAVSAEDERRGRIIERLMCDLAVDLDVEVGSNRRRHFEPELRSLDPLAAEGIVTIDGAHIRVTEKGRPFVRLVAAAFDAYLQDNKARHSAAV